MYQVYYFLSIPKRHYPRIKIKNKSRPVGLFPTGHQGENNSHEKYHRSRPIDIFTLSDVPAPKYITLLYC